MQKKNHQGVKRFKCSMCDKDFSQSYNLKAHERIHTGVKPYTCSVCKRKFSASYSLKVHERIHTGVKPYKCSICKMQFSASSSLQRHKRKYHGVKPYKCARCGKEFLLFGTLKTHERIIHTGVTPYKCFVCDKNFSRSGNLKKHERIHTGTKPYKCSVCKKKFNSSNNLLRHEKNHLGVKNHKCSVCEKEFVESYDLKRHKRIHTGVKPYKCSVCKKTFTQSGHLQKHERIHLRVKPFDCSVCKKESTESRQLMRKKTHSHIKLYKCPVCEKHFAHPGNLKVHKKIHRGGKCLNKSNISEPDISITVSIKDSTVHSKKGTIDKDLSSNVPRDKSKNLKYTFGGLSPHSKQRCKNHVCSICKEIFNSYYLLKKHQDSSHEEYGRMKLRNTSKSDVHNSSESLRSVNHNGREIKTYGCVLCNEKFTTKYFLMEHARISHENSALNCSSMQKNNVVKNNGGSKHIQICQKEGMRLRNEKVTNNPNNSELEVNYFVQNLEVEESRVSQEKESSEKIQSGESIDITKETSVHESHLAELQANKDSEFSEEIVIENGETPLETGTIYNMTCQEEELDTVCEDSETDDNESTDLSTVEQGGTRIAKIGERTVSEICEGEALEVSSTDLTNREKNYHDNSEDFFNGSDCLESIEQISEKELHCKSLKRNDVPKEPTLSSGKEHRISEKCLTDSEHGNKTKGNLTVRTKVTCCSRLGEQNNSTQSDNESMEQIPQGYRQLTVDSVDENNMEQAGTSRPLHINKPILSIMLEKKHSFKFHRPSYSSRDKPFSQRIDEMLNRPNTSQAMPCLTTNRNLEISYASYYEYMAVDNWMKN